VLPFDPHDLSGVWQFAPGGGGQGPGDNFPPLTPWGQEKWSQTRPSGRQSKLAFVYLPNQKDWNDPLFLCDPSGYPRTGGGNSLVRMVQTPDEVLQFFERDHFWRDLWTDGRKLPGDNAKPRWYGYSIGHWEGNTLVVTSMGFTDRTWLHWSGYYHSNEMVVTERLRREGDTLIYQATVDDPVMFLEPWTMDAIRLNLNKTPGLQLMQDVPYNDKSLGNLTDPNYRG
jgi:hypothetical protein